MSLSHLWVGRWGSGYNESVMFCFFDYFVQNRWYKWYKKHKTLSKISLLRWIMHQSFITTAPHPHTHKQGIAGTMALGLAESHSPALYNNKFNGVYMHNITSPALTWRCGGNQKANVWHIIPAIPAHPRRCVCGGGGVSDYKWLVHYESSCLSSGSKKKVISSQCALDVSIISGKPEVHPIISLR